MIVKINPVLHIYCTSSYSPSIGLCHLRTNASPCLPSHTCKRSWKAHAHTFFITALCSTSWHVMFLCLCVENTAILQTNVFSSMPCVASICILYKCVAGCLYAVRPHDFYSLCVYCRHLPKDSSWSNKDSLFSSSCIQFYVAQRNVLWIRMSADEPFLQNLKWPRFTALCSHLHTDFLLTIPLHVLREAPATAPW